jgi:RNA polymerase sigma factor (sigma-70 family)
MDDLVESVLEVEVEVEEESREHHCDASSAFDAEADDNCFVAAEQEDTAPEQPLLAMREFEALVRAHSPRLYSFVRRRIGNPADVEDIVQDTFVEAMKGMSRFKGTSRPETWIFGIAMNLVRNHYKRRRVRDVVDYDQEVDALAEEIDSNPATLCEHREILQRLNVACGQLNEETRIVLERVFDDCLTYEEAASSLGIPVGTVRSRISRVRSQLRRMTEA